jgi:hypothetical protein
MDAGDPRLRRHGGLNAMRLHEITATETARRIALGETTARAVIEACLEQTPRKLRAAFRQTTSSARAAISAIVSSGPTGTATTIRAAPWRRMAARADFMVAPVASPSSTSIAVRPAGSIRGRLPRYSARRRSISASSRARARSI